MEKQNIRDLKVKADDIQKTTIQSVEAELTEMAMEAAIGGPGDNIFTGSEFDTVVSLLATAKESMSWKQITGIEDDIDSWIRESYKAEKSQGLDPQPTNQSDWTHSTQIGIPHPVSYLSVKALKDVSPHHASCIMSKVNATVGLGFVNDDSGQRAKDDPNVSPDMAAQVVADLLTSESYVQTDVDKYLNPLCMHTFQHELHCIAEDYYDGGSGYLEVVRDEAYNIIGLNWMPQEDAYAHTIRDNLGRTYLFYRYTKAYNGSYNRFFCPFGIENKKKCLEFFYNSEQSKAPVVSEVIAFIKPSNRTRWYGYPDWLSAVPQIDLFKRALQYKSDFFTNRGVLDYILALKGQVDQKDWLDIQAAVKNSVGAGKNFRNMAIKMSADGGLDLHKLSGTGSKEEQFTADASALSEFIVSAHRVPPVLANILISGKLGAANETIQALIAFQLLNVWPNQKIFQTTLGDTLGGPEGVKGLNPESFMFRKITSQFNINGLDAASRSRQEAVAETNPDGSKRDFTKGVKQ